MKTRKKVPVSCVSVDESRRDSAKQKNLTKHSSDKRLVGTTTTLKTVKEAKECKDESYDEIYEMLKREERLKKIEMRKNKKKKTGNSSIVLKNIQVSTPAAQVRGKRKKHFEFGVSPILVNGNKQQQMDQATRELCDSLRRQRLKEIKEQEKMMETSAILRAKALLEKLRQPQPALVQPTVDNFRWQDYKAPSILLSKRHLSMDDSEEMIIKRKSIRKENYRISSSEKSSESCSSDDETVDRSASGSLNVPSVEIHDASQNQQSCEDENHDSNSDQSQLSVPSLDESSLKMQKTVSSPPLEVVSVQPVKVLTNVTNLINERKSQQGAITSTRTLRSTKAVSFPHEKTINETNQTQTSDIADKSIIKAGKWRRSLIEWRKSRARSSGKLSTVIPEESVVSVGESALLEQSDEGNLHAALSILDGSIKCAATFHDQRKTSQRKTSVFERSSIFYGLQHSSILIDTTNASSSSPPPAPLTARQIALRRCGQQEPLAFDEIYSESQLPNCVKIGEGVFGEVFMFKCPSTNQPVVLKIIPIEGRTPVNGETQKGFDEILQEIVISVELSALRNGKDNVTDGFVNVKRVTCVKGAYPQHLIDEWELFRDNRPEGSENDHPEIFDDDQLYIVFELCNGGRDLEAFIFNNALEAQSVFFQTALTLAVAEQKFEFEHRDLHWGNILIAPTTEKTVEYRINGKIIKILTHGVKVTIIDYSLSRMVYDGAVLYDNLARDEELFEASGDYQFDIYRLMRQRVENNFERFEPFTNLLWLHYIIDKLINGARYRYTKTKKHRAAIDDLMLERDELLNFASASDYADHMNF